MYSQSSWGSDQSLPLGHPSLDVIQAEDGFVRRARIGWSRGRRGRRRGRRRPRGALAAVPGRAPGDPVAGEAVGGGGVAGAGAADGVAVLEDGNFGLKL